MPTHFNIIGHKARNAIKRPCPDAYVRTHAARCTTMHTRTHYRLLATYKQVRHWQSLSSEDRLARNHYWRAKRANGGKPNGFWTGRQWLRLCERAEWRCSWCGVQTDELVPDHLQPIARGGTNELTNIVPSCPTCNLKRGTKSVAEWLSLPEFATLYRRLHPEAAEALFGPSRN